MASHTSVVMHSLHPREQIICPMHVTTPDTTSTKVSDGTRHMPCAGQTMSVAYVCTQSGADHVPDHVFGSRREVVVMGDCPQGGGESKIADRLVVVGITRSLSDVPVRGMALAMSHAFGPLLLHGIQLATTTTTSLTVTIVIATTTTMATLTIITLASLTVTTTRITIAAVVRG